MSKPHQLARLKLAQEWRSQFVGKTGKLLQQVGQEQKVK